jgi:ATP adenylyltransferase
MERIWAPWRMEFILSDKDGRCFLCDAAAAPASADRDNYVICRAEGAFVIMNRYPYNNGHLLVAPVRHEGRFDEIRADEFAAIDRLAQAAVGIMRRVVNAEGYNLGYNLGKVAGAGVQDHLHLHVVPRWSGDTNFMPVINDTHVIPQAMTELYDVLRPHFAAIETGVAS